jgi:peroxiredoxin
MNDLMVGSPAPRFSLPSVHGTATVPDPKGRSTVLMFFQEAQTPTCTAQMGSLRDADDILVELGAVAVGVSCDPLDRQRAFSASVGSDRLDLASDPDGEVARAFGVYDDAARKAHRAAFVIDGSGTIVHANFWYNPMNSEQFAELFLHLGIEDDSET